MHSSLEAAIAGKIGLLNTHGEAVVFVITGANGCGKSMLAKHLLVRLPFHQTFHLGAVTKTLRFLDNSLAVSPLENFEDKRIDDIFTPLVQFACREYRQSGVNVLVDGVQIDTGSPEWEDCVTCGVILRVDSAVRQTRNHYPNTHFNRTLELDAADRCSYVPSSWFMEIDNSYSFDSTYLDALSQLDAGLGKQLNSLPQR